MAVRKKAQEMTVNVQDAPGASNLTAADRCDHGACGAAGRTRVVYASGADLVFCRHHTNEFRGALVSSGATLFEDIDQAVSSPAS